MDVPKTRKFTLIYKENFIRRIFCEFQSWIPFFKGHPLYYLLKWKYCLKFPHIFLKELFSREDSQKANLFLYTRNNTLTKYELNSDNLKNSSFNSTLKTYLIVHGYIDSSNNKWVLDIKNNLLAAENANVIAVDWGEASSLIGNSWMPYVDAAGNTKIIGRFVASFLNATKIDPQSVHCIGHSLGAHLCGIENWISL